MSRVTGSNFVFTNAISWFGIPINGFAFALNEGAVDGVTVTKDNELLLLNLY